ncbi:uncharacterized protein GGS25DRAFT_489997 [Hypoxylon fragiforme]|uniref:uncharacterized protein n=1 Tax=Hypoxylon fragiforme TaxID=63214 RepID=UPI0020C6FAA3|nr:uncharacterized protein GGS25DRAFT_489997 [Hypoxylon fragiforme]KAI2608385.1 hypothetical protein GGS25DRAFT_489997 [Hypoxylon fragiforme]
MVANVLASCLSLFPLWSFGGPFLFVCVYFAVWLEPTLLFHCYDHSRNPVSLSDPRGPNAARHMMRFAPRCHAYRFVG